MNFNKDDFKLDVTVRQNCPECGSRNALSITRKVEGLFWNCFDASCNVKGRQLESGIDPRTALLKINGEERVTIIKWHIPDHFVAPRAKTLEFLDKYNALAAYEKDMVDVKYDPKLDRHVFIIWSNGRCIGGVGRMDPKVPNTPKWLVYGDSSSPLLVGDTDRAVVVEDALSACAVAGGGEFTGFSLGGTNFRDSYIPSLKNYEEITVALDRDASSKGLQMASDLRSYHPNVRCVFLREDLKYNTPKQIQEIIDA